METTDKDKKRLSEMLDESSSSEEDAASDAPEVSSQGSHSDWKTWKNGDAFSSEGKVGEF